ncbi:unnamed protein product [Mycena citricolor]|uniref:TNT domain-containing protein n=1 Tax=Mycena citricolor TaxID=2018698 RepID=A0AAD2HXZ2_9AGAR|nr:unnamed protein product [Mycena citricolor]
MKEKPFPDAMKADRLREPKGILPLEREPDEDAFLPSFILSTVWLVCSVKVGATQTPRCEPSFCHGTKNSPHHHDYLCGDERLGPKHLPNTSHWGQLLYGYKRFDGLCPAEFLAKWYRDGEYRLPRADGFQQSTKRKPIAEDQVLDRGMLVDCFGTLYETYLSPAGTPFSLRALPPSSLNTPTYDDIALYNYRVFRVEYPFVVKSGPTAPFYEQPGQGTVYRTTATIDMLISGGFLARVG